VVATSKAPSCRTELSRGGSNYRGWTGIQSQSSSDSHIAESRISERSSRTAPGREEKSTTRSSWDCVLARNRDVIRNAVKALYLPETKSSSTEGTSPATWHTKHVTGQALNRHNWTSFSPLPTGCRLFQKISCSFKNRKGTYLYSCQLTRLVSSEYGIPEVAHTDEGTQCVFEEFRVFADHAHPGIAVSRLDH